MAKGDQDPAKPGKPDDGGPIVEVSDLHTNEDAKFHAGWTDTVQQIWDRAYNELGETRKETDVFPTSIGARSKKSATDFSPLHLKTALPVSPGVQALGRRMRFANCSPTL